MRSLLPAVLLFVLATAQQAVAASGRLQTSHCRLVIVGYGPGRLGIAAASLNCTGSSPIAVGINHTYLAKFSKEFEGVNVNASQDCQRQAEGGGVHGKPVYALLYFCADSVHLVLDEIRVTNTSIHTGNDKWTTALVVFGGGAMAAVHDGLVRHSQFGSAFVVMNQAALDIHDTTISNNLGLEGVGVVSTDDTVLNMTNSVIGSNKGGIITGNSSAVGSGSSNSGGALYASGSAVMNIVSSVLANNTAGFGAGFYAKESARILLEESQIHNNTVTARGAGCFIEGSVQVTVRSSNVTLNTAGFGYGGGLYISESCNMSVEDSRLVGNTAAFSGGAFFVRHNGILNISNSALNSNTANIYGGGIFAQENGTVRITNNSILSSNTVMNSGGGVTCMNRAKVYASNSTFNYNSANSAGGAAWISEFSNLTISNCTLKGNTALEYGGAVAALHSAAILMGGYTRVLHSTAPVGGAMHCKDNSSIALNAGVVLRDNTAGKEGGAIAAEGSAKVLLKVASLLHNKADKGGGIDMQQSAEANLTDSSLVANIATEGGGIRCSGRSRLQVTGRTVVAHNAAVGNGGGVACLDNCSLAIISECHASQSLQHTPACTSHPVIEQNTAEGGRGGGVLIDSSRFNATQLMQIVQHNTAQYGQNIYAGVAALTVAGNTTVTDFVSRLAATEGVMHVELHVMGHNGLPSEGMLVQAVLSSLQGSDVQYLAANRSNAQGTVMLSLKVVRPPGSYSLRFELPEALDVQPARMNVTIRSCIVGEVTPSPDVCMVCMKGSYSLDPSLTICEPCPTGADCPGGAVINPLPGMWHSSPFSDQIHRCPGAQACQGDRSALQNCSSTIRAAEAAEIQPSTISTAAAGPDSCMVAAYSDKQCSVGYTGNLCGICAPGYGSIKPFVCRLCLQPNMLIGLYVLAGFVMLGLMLVFCHCAVVATNETPPTRPVTPAAPSPQVMRTFASRPTTPIAMRPTQLTPAASIIPSRDQGSSVAPSQNSTQPADLIRPLILYINCLLIMANLSVEWPAPMSHALQGLSWVWAVATPHTLSVDCLLPHSGPAPPAVLKVLFYLLMPMVLSLVAVLLQGLLSYIRHHMRKTRSSHYLAASGMVGLLVFLPALLNTTFLLFACVAVDKSIAELTEPHSTTAAAVISTAVGRGSVGRFWVYDMSVQCLVGDHLMWASALGVPVILLTCGIIPTSILWVTLRHKSSPGFYQHYKFLVQPYRPEYCYWEAVVIFQVIVLVAISVYGSAALGAYYSLILLNVVFAVMGGLLLGLQPCASRKANMIALCAVCCLLLTSYVMLTLLLYAGSQASAAYTLAMGVILIAVNASFIAYVVCCILKSFAWKKAGLKVVQLSQSMSTTLSHSLQCSFTAIRTKSGSLGLASNPSVRSQSSQTLP